MLLNLSPPRAAVNLAAQLTASRRANRRLRELLTAAKRQVIEATDEAARLRAHADKLWATHQRYVEQSQWCYNGVVDRLDAVDLGHQPTSCRIPLPVGGDCIPIEHWRTLADGTQVHFRSPTVLGPFSEDSPGDVTYIARYNKEL